MDDVAEVAITCNDIWGAETKLKATIIKTKNINLPQSD